MRYAQPRNKNTVQSLLKEKQSSKNTQGKVTVQIRKNYAGHRSERAGGHYYVGPPCMGPREGIWLYKEAKNGVGEKGGETCLL